MSAFNTWVLDPVKRDYVMDETGAPINNSDLKTPSYIRIATPRSKWMYAPNSSYGSDFYLYNKRKVAQDVTLFEALMQDCLQPIIDDGRAGEVNVTLTQNSMNALGFETAITDIQGKIQEVSFDPIGG